MTTIDEEPGMATFVVEPTGLPRVPRRDVARRLNVATRSVVRHLGPLAVPGRRRSAADTARRLRLVFDDLGATFTKFGQLLASAPSLFGEEVAAEFRGCLDAGPPVPFFAVRAAVESELGRPLDDVFSEFAREPIAAASLAVVHRARLLNGSEVAVKVLRPGVEEMIAGDLALMRPVFELVGRQVAVGVAGTLPGLVDGLDEQVREELDLRNEARALDWFELLARQAGLDLVAIPRAVPGLATRRVLAMEFLDGFAIDDTDAIAAAGIDLAPAVQQALQLWFLGTLCHGAFHGDIHAGNLLALPDERIGILDWGITGRLDRATHRFFRRTIEGLLGDDSAWRDVRDHVSSVYGGGLQTHLGLDDDQMALFVRRQVEPLFVTPFKDLDLRTMLIGSGPGPTAGGPAPAGHGDTTRPRELLRAKYRYWQEQRAIQRRLLSSPGRGSGFDRGTFLLSKQLVYLERYGKLYLADTPLLWDRDVFAALLAATPR